MDQVLSDSIATNVWKLFPFKSGNRAWLVVLLKAYLCCAILGFCLACMLNAVEGDRWLRSSITGDHGVKSNGDTALDECFWFVFTTMHGVGFGEFMARGVTGRLIAMLCCTLYYLFTIFVMSIIMLSQLPGEKVPSLRGVASRMFCSLWPSYCLFLSVVLAVGSVVGPYISKDHEGKNEWPTGMYWAWTTVHRTPYGDIWPDTVFGRTATVPLACLSVLYMPYALACIAVRSPSLAQHREIVRQIRDNAEDALGKGYVTPANGEGKLQEFVMHDGYVQENDDDDDVLETKCRIRCCGATCAILVLAVVGCTFAGKTPTQEIAEVAEEVEHALELDLPPGIRSRKNPVPEVVWSFSLSAGPPSEKALALIEDMKQGLDTDVQLVTLDTMLKYNVTEEPFHPAFQYLAPNHKIDYLQAYFSHHYGGGFMMELQPRINKTRWTGPIKYLLSNDTHWFLGAANKERPVPCDESNIEYAWCKELQFRSDVTYADTKIGRRHFGHSQGPCCGKVLEYFNASNATKSFPNSNMFIVRKETPFTAEWLNLVNTHLTKKLAILKKAQTPSKPCCQQKEGNYPLRMEELRGEMWSVLVMRYNRHIKHYWRDFFGVDLILD